MDKCLVFGCSNTLSCTDPSIQYYHFPKDPIMLERWLQSCCIWNTNEIDLNIARVCSIHFDRDCYTSDYKMLDFGYVRLLKEDAVPTLYLPQQTVLYKITNIDEDNFNSGNYESSIRALENEYAEHTAKGPNTVQYEELQAIPLEDSNCAVKVNEAPIVKEKYNVTTYKQLEEIKMKNDKMKKEVIQLEQSVSALKKQLNNKMDEYKKSTVEGNKLSKILNSLETKRMTVSEQKGLLSKVFSESQIKILCGKKKIYWSHDDMAVAYTIRHLSSKRCYVHLSKNLNIPLPGLSSIKRWQSLKKQLLPKEEKIEKDDKPEDSDEMT